MPPPSGEHLEAFLKRQAPEALAAVLLELARDHEAVRARLERMLMAGDPKRLAAEFRKTLASWRRSRRHRVGAEAREFGQLLEGWLDQVERELTPADPRTALALFETFIEADRHWFDQADDSDGVIGDAMRLACRLWLRAASRSGGGIRQRADRLAALYDADEYGSREALLREADLLLGEEALKELVSTYEAQLKTLVSSRSDPAERPHGVYHVAGALSLLADALRDPGVHVRAVLLLSPEPNPVQKEHIVRRFLEAGRAADALPWLEGQWERLEPNRRSLLAEALGRLGRFEESAPILRDLFEQTLAVADFERWLEHLPEASRPDAREQAHRRALEHPDPAGAAELLLALGDPAAADEKLVSMAGDIDGSAYYSLAPLADALRKHGCPRGETAVYRALLETILEKGNQRAYGHGARYLLRLRELGRAPGGLVPLSPHGEFEAALRSRHGRKTSFWPRVA